MNKEQKINNLQNKSTNSEIENLKKALQEKDKELAERKKQLEQKNQEKEEIRQVLKDEEEKSLLRKYGFASEELENIRLLSQGEITENKLRELKTKANQKRTNAFISLLQDENIYQKEQTEPWEKEIKYMETHPKGKIR